MVDVHVPYNNIDGGNSITYNYWKKNNNTKQMWVIMSPTKHCLESNEQSQEDRYPKKKKRAKKWLSKIEYAKKKTQEFADHLKFVAGLPAHEKPTRKSWELDKNNRRKIRSLVKYALGELDARNDTEIELEIMAERILEAMGLPTTSQTAAAKVLISIGYFSLHENLHLVKAGFCPYKEDDEELHSEVDRLLESRDKDDDIYRKDLTGLKVYAIDPEGAEELDDALSVTRLEDGRIKVWIHIADPTSLVKPGSLMDKEARNSGTSVYLPTGTYPMFPKKLAMEGMSLKEGERCKTISTSVVLNNDGSIGEYSVDITSIKPTNMLTYQAASELLNLTSTEEEVVDLRLLLDAAEARFKWRVEHGADTKEFISDARLKVANVNDPEPSIEIYNEDQQATAKAHKLVTEMMLLCGEVIACFGSRNNIILPYRVHGRFTYSPEPNRDLGLLQGYVQFTSPIRRYTDLLAHYQVKAFINKKELFIACELLRMGGHVNERMNDARNVVKKSTRYWMIEYLRQSQSRGKTFSAQVIRCMDYEESAAQIQLTDLGFKNVVTVFTNVKEGDMIKVKVEKADPRDNFVALRMVSDG